MDRHHIAFDSAQETTLLNAVPTPLLRVNAGGMVVWLNTSAKQRLSGVLREGRPLLELWHDPAEGMAALAHLLGPKATPVDLALRPAAADPLAAHEPTRASANALPGGGWMVALQPLAPAAPATGAGTVGGGAAHAAGLHGAQATNRFLARMSHELRTPLNAVLGFSQLLLDDYAGADATNVRQRQRLEHIQSAGQHLLNLINDVLDLSSLEGGEVRIERQPVDMEIMVETTLPLLGPLLRGGEGVPHVNLQVGPLQATALADATRLRQVLLNLLSNAVKYNREGGSVSVQAYTRGKSVVLRVADTGRGMNDEQMQHLFEPFNRLGLGGGSIEGSGIGLAIAKALVERMGGSVHVDSKEGRGSVFEVRLAAADRGEDFAPETVSGAMSLGGKRRGQVLYIEDNPVNALIVTELLARRTDLKLHLAVDGTSGVAQARALVPDLILLDMQLPDFDGYEVLRRLRADPSTAGIRCVALSANVMPQDIQRARQAGVADYWTKPLDIAAFLAAMDQMFGSKR